MNKIFKQCLTALLLSSACVVNNSNADDSVFLNLSVLDNLNSAPQISSAVQEPLFPIVKKTPQSKPAKASKPTKKSKVKVKVYAPKAEPQLQKVEVKVVEPEKVETKPISAPQIPYIESDEKVEVVDIEPTAMVENIAPQTDTNIVPEQQESGATAPQVVEDVSLPAPTEPAVNQPQSLEVDSPVVIATPETPKPELLIDESISSSNQNISTGLTFLPDIDELTPEQQQQIDIAINSFEDAHNNKIGIYAYNLDDGVDTFKRKRMSLNRAVAVRSYLLPKGYKNFSIKVINVDSASGKGNTVELEEIRR